jgi:HK97 family phage major capsid protein
LSERGGEEESRSVTATPKIGLLSIPTHEQYAMPKVTQTMLDDSVIDIAAWLQMKTNDIISRTENTAFVSGNGSKKPEGFLNLSAWTTVGTYERGKLEHISSGVNGTSAGLGLVADKIIEVQDSLLEAYQEGAVWVMNRMTWSKVKTLKDGSGQYLLDRDLLKTNTSPMLLGKPVVFSTDMAKPSDYTTGTLAIAYGNFKRGYQIVDRTGIRVLRDPLTAKPYIQFYTTKRVGGAVKNYQAIKLLKLSA